MASSANNNSVRINKSMVMKAAWETLRRHKAMSFSEALRKAWHAYKLKARWLLELFALCSERPMASSGMQSEPLQRTSISTR